MPNQYKNKVVYGGTTLIDLTADTVTADTLLVGRTAHSASGELIVGTFEPYPVGAIYMSTESTDPSTLFGGTWQAIENRFLFGAGSWYAAGDTGGEATHTLTVDEMPSHKHTYKRGGGAFGQNAIGVTVTRDLFSSTDQNMSSVGGGQAHNNMPPYLVVYIWKRTA